MKNILLLILVSLALTACAAPNAATPAPAPNAADTDVVAEGHIVPAQDLRLAFTARGVVEEILVKEGQSVSKGDVLARLGDREQAQAALTATQLELISAQQAFDDFLRAAPLSTAQAWQVYMDTQKIRAEAERAWEKLDLDALDDQIEEAEADLKDLKSDLDDAQEEADKYKDLNKDNATRKKADDALEKAQKDFNEAQRKMEELVRERDEARAVLNLALSNETEAKRKYDLTKDGPDGEKQALLEARLTNAKAQVASAESALANYELTAPFTGIVTDVYLTLGESAGPEKTAFQIADFSAFYVETSDLTELEVVNLAIGQPVSISPDALPGLALRGEVEYIGQSFRTQGGDVLYTVKIRLTETDPALRWGMTVEVAFLPQ